MQTSPVQNGQPDEALERLARLQALTAALAEATTSEQVADAILTPAAAVLGACAGVVYRLSDDGTEFVSLRMTGYPEEATAPWRRFPADARMPLADAVRQRQPVLLANRAERNARYPEIAHLAGVSNEGAVAALPLLVRGQALGGIDLRFPTDCTFTDQDQVFLLTVAGLGAQALDRTRLYNTERAARERDAPRWVGTLIDIDDRRRAEAALRASEERLRTLSDNVPHGAIYQIIADPHAGRRFLYISAGVERLFGVPPAEALADATTLYGLIHEDDQPRLMAAEKAALRDRAPFDCEFRSWTRSGELLWVHARSAPRLLPTGQVVWEGILLDITDRKTAEEALNRERELLGTIIERIPVMLTVYEPDTSVLRLNPAFERATGWSSRDAAGVSLMEHCYPDPAYRERVRAFMQSCRDGWMDLRMRTRDGRDLETSWANVRLSDGTQVGIGLDITDRKRHEEALKEADRRKDEFLATLAHELRNPLAPLRNGLELMKRAGSDARAVEQARSMMERQLAQMVRLIDDLLDVSRITRGKLELRKERVGLASVVQSAVEGSRPLIEASAHQLTVTLPPEPVYLDADPTRLAQVFGNLLTNAAKYTDPGGHISLTAACSGDEVAVTVRDTGIGIAAEHLPRLFEMFSQATPALERSQGGLGIGLALVRGLVEMHGGTVEAQSAGLGQGSLFTVRLPLAVGSSGPGPSPTEMEKGRCAPTCRILVADDNRDAADSLALILRLAGHEVHTAHDGQEAVEAASWFRPDAALLDIGMPKLNGYEACRRIREQPAGKGAVLVALTGWGQEDDKRRASEAGFDFHLTKPVDPAALEQLLADLPSRG